MRHTEKGTFCLGPEQALVRIASEIRHGVDQSYTPVQILCCNLDREDREHGAKSSYWWDTFSNWTPENSDYWDAVSVLFDDSIARICIDAVYDAAKQHSSIPPWGVLDGAMPNVTAGLAYVRFAAARDWYIHIGAQRLAFAIASVMLLSVPYICDDFAVLDAKAEEVAARAFRGEVMAFNARNFQQSQTC